MNSIFHRTSIRKYTEQKVEPEKITQIMKAAMASPSAANQQPWEFYVVQSPEKLQELSMTSPYAGCTAKAPLAFVACYRKDCRIPEYAQIDMSATCMNLLLEIDSLGLGGVWLGIAPIQKRMDAVKEVLNIPDSLEVFAILPCGYPAEERTQQDRYEESRIHYVD